MEEWYRIVQTLKDESMDPYITGKFVEHVFLQLKNTKIKEKQKFKNRMGPEFEEWVESLHTSYSDVLITNILSNDDFWLETLKRTQKI